MSSLTSSLRRFDDLFGNGTLDERRLFLRQFLHRIELDPVDRCGTAYWYGVEHLAGLESPSHLLGLIGATGFEPATSASRMGAVAE